MPELPEVEIARHHLEKWLLHRRISGARILDRRMLRGQLAVRFVRAVRGARLRRIRRRAKYLLWDLGGRGHLLAHLGMTGKFVYRTPTEPDPPGARVILEIGKRGRVVFADPRRLGRFQLVDRKLRTTLARLGVEPFDDSFTPMRLTELLRGVRAPAKTFLLDQHRVAGIGNIHASEALFLAKIHPARPAGSLSVSEVSRLHRAIRRTLASTIRRDCSAEPVYLHEGNRPSRFLVYDKEGDPCPRCRAPIRRLVQSGRSTYYCARCQGSKSNGPGRGPAMGTRAHLRGKS